MTKIIKKNKTENISIAITKELKQEIYDCSQIESRTMSSFVINAINFYLDNKHRVNK